MASLDARKVQKALVKKGFALVKDGDHRRFILMNGKRKTTIRTKMSHNLQDVGDVLIGLMADQLKISRQKFLNLVECTLSEEGYRALVGKTLHAPDDDTPSPDDDVPF